MNKQLAYLGIDVHKKTYNAALVRVDRNSIEFEKQISNNIFIVRKFIKELSKKYELRICYEAGCTGYQLYRKLTDTGLNCTVIAPSSLPRKFNKRKNDKIDARNLAKFYKSGILQPINVPDFDLEQDRDLIRFRATKTKNITQAKQRIKSFLLRRNIHYDHEKTWNIQFFDWLGTMELCLKDRLTLDRYLNDLNYETKLVTELDQEIEDLSKAPRYNNIVKILCGFRGINTTTAMIIATHIIDFRAFSNPNYLASYIGVTPGFENSGETKHTLGITKTGNSLLRKAFINAAQHYSKTKKTGAKLRKQRQDTPASIISIIERCDRRCMKQYWKLIYKGKNHNVAKTAIAREIIHFCWEAIIKLYSVELAKTA
jgi:transposase